eukprot:scaffold39.g4418.t1
MVLLGRNPRYRENQDLADLLPVRPGSEYLVELELDGDRYAYVYLFQYDQFGHKLGQNRVNSESLVDVPLNAEKGPRWVARRIALTPQTAYIRIGIEHRGNSWLSILKGRLTPIGGNSVTNFP